MGRDRSPTVRHRRLTMLLNRLRRDAGLSREQVSEHMEWAASKIGKVETGNWKQLQARDVRGLVELYGVTGKHEQDVYVRLARDARKRGWWQQYGDDIVGPYVGFEAEAARIQTFQPSYVPGLLQTEDYARALVEANPTNDNDAAENRLIIQMERQKLLQGKDAAEFWGIVEEQTVRRPVGGRETMRAQLDYILQVTAADHLTLQVLPLAAGAHPGMDGSFVLLSFADPDDRPLVYLETATDGLYLEKPEELHRYSLMYDHLKATAMSVPDSAALIRGVRDEM